MNPELINDRDWDWWLQYAGGTSQVQIARDAGVDQSTVSRALARVRAQIPATDREEMVQRSLAMLLELQREAMAVVAQAAAPVTAGKDGDLVIDPESGAYVRDHGGRLRAAETALKVNESVRRLLGLDAAQKLDMNVATGEERAAERLAQDAAARLSEGEE